MPIPKALLTHPKGLTESSSGTLYQGTKRGIRKGTSVKCKEAIQALKEIGMDQVLEKSREELVQICNE